MCCHFWIIPKYVKSFSLTPFEIFSLSFDLSNLILFVLCSFPYVNFFRYFLNSMELWVHLFNTFWKKLLSLVSSNIFYVLSTISSLLWECLKFLIACWCSVLFLCSFSLKSLFFYIFKHYFSPEMSIIYLILFSMFFILDNAVFIYKNLILLVFAMPLLNMINVSSSFSNIWNRIIITAQIPMSTNSVFWHFYVCIKCLILLIWRLFYCSYAYLVILISDD